MAGLGLSPHPRPRPARSVFKEKSPATMTSFAESNRLGAYRPNKQKRNGWAWGSPPPPRRCQNHPRSLGNFADRGPSKARLGSSSARQAHARGPLAPSSATRAHPQGSRRHLVPPARRHFPPPPARRSAQAIARRFQPPAAAGAGDGDRGRGVRGLAAAAGRRLDSDPARGTPPATAKACEGAGLAALGGAAAAEART